MNTPTRFFLMLILGLKFVVWIIVLDQKDSWEKKKEVLADLNNKKAHVKGELSFESQPKEVDLQEYFKAILYNEIYQNLQSSSNPLKSEQRGVSNFSQAELNRKKLKMHQEIMHSIIQKDSTLLATGLEVIEKYENDLKGKNQDRDLKLEERFKEPNGFALPYKKFSMGELTFLINESVHCDHVDHQQINSIRPVIYAIKVPDQSKVTNGKIKIDSLNNCLIFPFEFRTNDFQVPSDYRWISGSQNKSQPIHFTHGIICAENYIRNIENETRDSISPSLFVLSHEIRHAFQDTKRQRWELEYEADYFAGYILFNAGIPKSKIPLILNCISEPADREDPSHHPSLAFRRKAAELGWEDAQKGWCVWNIKASFQFMSIQ